MKPFIIYDIQFATMSNICFFASLIPHKKLVYEFTIRWLRIGFWARKSLKLFFFRTEIDRFRKQFTLFKAPTSAEIHFVLLQVTKDFTRNGNWGNFFLHGEWIVNLITDNINFVSRHRSNLVKIAAFLSTTLQLWTNKRSIKRKLCKLPNLISKSKTLHVDFSFNMQQWKRFFIDYRSDRLSMAPPENRKNKKYGTATRNRDLWHPRTKVQQMGWFFVVVSCRYQTEIGSCRNFYGDRDGKKQVAWSCCDYESL